MKFKPTLPTIFEDKEFEEKETKSPVISLRDECLLKVAENWDFFKKHHKKKVQKLPEATKQEIEILVALLKD